MIEDIMDRIKDSLGSLENLIEAGNKLDAIDVIMEMIGRLNALAKALGKNGD